MLLVNLIKITSKLVEKSVKMVPIRQKYAAESQPFTILIEGNIGSGKTTFLNHFKSFEKDICLVSEPVERWQNIGGDNLLDLMYKEPKQWAFPFQTYVTLTMLQGHTMETNKQIKLMERSIFSARYCFVENMYKTGVLDNVMYNVLQEWYSFVDKTMHLQTDLIVYLRTTPEIVYERMLKRGRSEENCVPLKLLQELHELHEDWLIHRRRGTNTKVIVLDAGLGLDDIFSEYKNFEDSVIKPSLEANSSAVSPVTYLSPSKRPCYSN